jgi:signal transduction histidine kinase
VSDLVNPPLLERYQRLTEITLDLASTLDLKILLNRIVQVAAELSSAEAASILLYDEVNQQLYFQSTTNLTEPLMHGLTVPVDSSIAGWIVTNRKPIIVSDTTQDPRHFDQVSKIVDVTTISLLGVPLIAKGKVVGVLEAINKLTGNFNLEDQTVLYTLGAQAAVAIENARLFQQSDLIAELIHELRTPLSSISTAAHLLLRPEVSEEQRSRMVEIIHDETFRLSEMASSYLDLARLESGRAQFNPVAFDIKALVEECIQVMRTKANEKGLRLQVVAPTSLPELTADRNKIKQVILNLLSNAIKYNRPSGSIIVTINTEDDEMCIEVKDSGMGIPPESISHLFEKFFRAPGSEHLASGTGLGLSICKYIVEAHRGRIDVESQAGIGTTFTVHLPIQVVKTNSRTQ